MNVLIIATAEYLLYAFVVAAGLIWLTRFRADKVRLAAQSLVFPYVRRVGVGTVLIGVARIEAHVHHSQDVVAGLGIGLSAGALAVIGVRWLVGVRGRRTSTLA